MQFVLLLISAIGGVVAAYASLLNYFSRNELPDIVARANGAASKAHNSDLTDRTIFFHLPTEPSPSKWMIDEVRIAKSRHKWLALPGEQENDASGRFLGYHRSGDWMSKVRYDPPIGLGSLLLHPDAPKHLRFRFRVRLRTRFRIRRRVDVMPWTL